MASYRFRFRFLDTSIKNGSFAVFTQQVAVSTGTTLGFEPCSLIPTILPEVFILKRVKVLCFATLSQAFILKGLKLTEGLGFFSLRDSVARSLGIRSDEGFSFAIQFRRLFRIAHLSVVAGER